MEFPMVIGKCEVNSLKELRDLAKDNTEAQMILADAFWEGDGVPQDYKKAFLLFEKAAAKDNSQALLNLGYMYRKGIACTVDLFKAEQLYLKAAELGDDEADGVLAEVYIYGMGPVKQDLCRGLEYAYKSVHSERGDDEILSWFGGPDAFEQIYEMITGGMLDDNSFRMFCQKLRQDQSPEYRKYEPAGLYDD